jgi:hypothetical protein
MPPSCGLRWAMSFKILFLVALFAPFLLIATGAILRGPKEEPGRNTQLPS